MRRNVSGFLHLLANDLEHTRKESLETSSPVSHVASKILNKTGLCERGKRSSFFVRGHLRLIGVKFYPKHTHFFSACARTSVEK
jgi:hypothetical protein